MNFRFARMLKPGAMLLCLSFGLAAVPANGETVDVTGVAADDVLNLRTEPRANAPLAGALSPTAAGIEVERRSGGWAYVSASRAVGRRRVICGLP
jgi:hypothetical protein